MARKNKDKKKFLKMQDLHNKLVVLAKNRNPLDLDNELVLDTIKRVLNAIQTYTSFGMIENLVTLVNREGVLRNYIDKNYSKDTEATDEFILFMDRILSEDLPLDKFKELVSEAFRAERQTVSVSSIRNMGKLVNQVRINEDMEHAKQSLFDMLKLIREAAELHMVVESEKLFKDIDKDLAKSAKDFIKLVNNNKEKIKDKILAKGNITNE